MAVEKAFGAAAVRVELRGVGSRTTTIAATRRLPGFAEFNLAGGLGLGRFGVPLQAQLRFENVFDVQYELIELYPEAGRRVSLRLQTNIGGG